MHRRDHLAGELSIVDHALKTLRELCGFAREMLFLGLVEVR